MNAALLIGRLIFGGFFRYNGVNHFKEREAKGIPQPDLAVQFDRAMLAIGARA